MRAKDFRPRAAATLRARRLSRRRHPCPSSVRAPASPAQSCRVRGEASEGAVEAPSELEQPALAALVGLHVGVALAEPEVELLHVLVPRDLVGPPLEHHL